MEKDKIITTTHFSKSGELYTQEIHPFGQTGCYEVIKDALGNVIPTSGSGGFRPWVK